MPYTDWTLEQLQQASDQLRTLINQMGDVSIEFALRELDIEMILRNLTKTRDRTCTN